jgi:hypothetical protein
MIFLKSTVVHSEKLVAMMDNITVQPNWGWLTAKMPKWLRWRIPLKQRPRYNEAGSAPPHITATRIGSTMNEAIPYDYKWAWRRICAPLQWPKSPKPARERQPRTGCISAQTMEVFMVNVAGCSDQRDIGANWLKCQRWAGIILV